MILVILSTYLCSCASVAIKSNAKVVRWIEQVLMGPEFGGKGEICSRWVITPTLSVYGATAQEERVVAETVAHLNETLANTSIKKLMLVESNSAAAIRVYFAPLRELPALAHRHGFNYEEGNLGYFWTFWNSKHEIAQAYILIAADRLHGAELQHFALEELTQALGLSNDSPVFRNSIFYAGSDGGGNAEKLSNLDKRLLIFFYNHIKPGTKIEGLRTAISKHWLEQ